MDNIYTDSAQFGLFITKIVLVIAILSSIILFGMGIKSLLTKETYTKTIKATVLDRHTDGKESSCSIYSHENKMRNITVTNAKYKCSLVINYMIDGKQYFGHLQTNGYEKYKPGDTIDIEYNENDPNDFRVISMTNKNKGLMFISISLFITALALIQYFIIRKYKFAAAGYALSSVISLL